VPTQGVTPSEFREVSDADKTRMIELPYGEKSMTICLAVFTWYRNITDRQTDRQNCCINIACDKKTLPFFVFTITCHMPADLAHFLHRYKWVVLQYISAYLLINSRKSSRQSSTVALPETCLFSNTIALETQWHAGAGGSWYSGTSGRIWLAQTCGHRTFLMWIRWTPSVCGKNCTPLLDAGDLKQLCLIAAWSGLEDHIIDLAIDHWCEQLCGYMRTDDDTLNICSEPLTCLFC